MYKAHSHLGKYFEKIKSNTFLTTQWDLFYLCFLIGLATNEKDSPQDETGGYRDIISNPTDGFREIDFYSTLIVQHLKNDELEITDKKNLKNRLERLIDLDEGKLSEQGYKVFNEYAYAGFELLQTEISPNPTDGFTTFRHIHKKLKENFK